jgi:hypothetical protein
VKRLLTKKTSVAVLSLLLLFLSFGTGVFADSLVQEIKAYLVKDVTVKVDGEVQVFKDADGKVVYPISYNGTTYLPLRSIGGLMDKEVKWDNSTRTVLLGKDVSTEGLSYAWYLDQLTKHQDLVDSLTAMFDSVTKNPEEAPADLAIIKDAENKILPVLKALKDSDTSSMSKSEVAAFKAYRSNLFNVHMLLGALEGYLNDHITNGKTAVGRADFLICMQMYVDSARLAISEASKLK